MASEGRWVSIARKLLGGRPMRPLGGRRFAPFTDCVTGKPVRYWTANGRTYMATGAWAWFRVEVTR